MANKFTANQLNVKMWASTAGLASLRRTDIVAIVGDTQIAAPTTAADGWAFGQLGTAIVPIIVDGGTIAATLWVGFISSADSSRILWNIAPGTGALSLTAEGGWLVPTGCPDRIAVQIVISSGSPSFAVNIGGIQ